MFQIDAKLKDSDCSFTQGSVAEKDYRNPIGAFYFFGEREPYSERGNSPLDTVRIKRFLREKMLASSPASTNTG